MKTKRQKYPQGTIISLSTASVLDAIRRALDIAGEMTDDDGDLISNDPGHCVHYWYADQRPVRPGQAHTIRSPARSTTMFVVFEYANGRKQAYCTVTQDEVSGDDDWFKVQFDLIRSN